MGSATLIALVLAAAGPLHDHGARQIAAMFADRPVMATSLTTEHPLVVWTIDQFNGAGAGAPVFWDDDPPPPGIDAEHTPPQRSARASVRVLPVYAAGPLKDQPKPFADQWADLIFEFHNLANARLYAQIHSDVSAGKLSAAEWLSALTRGEHAALLETAAFYRQKWLTWMAGHPLAGETRRWYQIFETDPDFGRWMVRYQRHSGYPYATLGRYFEQVLQPHRFEWGVEYRSDPAALPHIHWRPRASMRGLP